jgi:hypothetical protein
MVFRCQTCKSRHVKVNNKGDGFATQADIPSVTLFNPRATDARMRTEPAPGIRMIMQGRQACISKSRIHLPEANREGQESQRNL